MKFNPGRLNKRATFKRLQSIQNEFAGTSSELVDALTTWAERRTINSNNQFAIEAGASAMNEDAVFIIRKRASFTPTKEDVIIMDGFEYTIKAIAPYMERNQDVIHETDFWYLVGVRGK